MKFFASQRRCADTAMLALLMLASFQAARADQMFVIDKVILNVYAEPDQDSGRIGTLQTGDAVEATERLDGYVRVLLDDGQEGWVRENYLSADAPAIVRLRQLQEGQPAAQQVVPPQLTQEIERLKKQNSALRNEVTALQEKQAQSPKPVPAAVANPNPVQPPKEPPQTTASVPVSVPETETETESTSSDRVWLWPALTVLSGAMGFVLGYQALASRIRRKYGSVRIY